MIKLNVAKEKQQLIDHWKKIAVSASKENWLGSTSWKIRQISELLNRTDLDNAFKKKSINGHIRKFTDKLGLQAWGHLERGGQCAGAIYRTTAFIDLETSKRIGSKNLKTIHIEHTVPASVLSQQLIEIGCLSPEKLNPEYIFFYLLKYSVCTAMLDHQGRQGALIRNGFSSSTDAFSFSSLGYNKPFLRYNQVVNDTENIWDVWNERIIDPEKFTFADHLSTLREIANTSDSKDVVNLINKFDRI